MKSCCVLKDQYDDKCDKILFYNTTSDLQNQDQDQDHSVQDQNQDRDQVFLVSDQSCPKSDGLRPHHCLQTETWRCFACLVSFLVCIMVRIRVRVNVTVKSGYVKLALSRQCQVYLKSAPNLVLARVQIRGPRSLSTIKRRNNTYDVTHFT